MKRLSILTFVFFAGWALLLCTKTACSREEEQQNGDANGNDNGNGHLDPEILDLKLYPPTSPITAYEHGPSFILGEVITEEGARVTLDISVEPHIEAILEPSEGLGSRVFEVWLRPTSGDVGESFVLEVRATSGETSASASVAGDVIIWSVDDNQFPDELLADFLDFIGSNNPEIGLSVDTQWIESWSFKPAWLVVSHWAYLFEEWFLNLSWHVTVAPDDWAILEVRRRDQIDPGFAFCIPSYSADRAVREVDTLDPRASCLEDN